MSVRRYKKIALLLPEIKDKIELGMTHKEIEEYFKLKGDRPIHNLLKRERRKERKLEAGILLNSKGRPQKNTLKRDVTAEQEYEIKRLRMENELL